MSKTELRVVDVNNDMVQLAKTSNAEEQITIQRQKLQEMLDNHTIELDVPKYRCVKKLRNKQNIIHGYVLEGTDQRRVQTQADQLKYFIRNYRMTVTNLKLTADNRLISIPDVADKFENHELQDNATNTTTNNKQTHVELSRDLVEKIMSALIQAQKKLNTFYAVIEICGSYNDKSAGEWKSIGKSNLMVQIRTYNEGIEMSIQPSKGYVISLPENSDLLFVNKHTIDYESNEQMFRLLDIRLDGLDWGKVVSARKMFLCTKFESISIENQSAPNLTDMEQFAQLSEADMIDLSSFKVPRVENAKRMFSCCVALNVDDLYIEGINLKYAKDVSQMVGIPYHDDDFLATSDVVECSGGLKGLLDGTSDVRLKAYPLERADIEMFVWLCKYSGWRGYKDGRPDDIAKIKSDTYIRLRKRRDANDTKNV